MRSCLPWGARPLVCQAHGSSSGGGFRFSLVDRMAGLTAKKTGFEPALPLPVDLFSRPGWPLGSAEYSAPQWSGTWRRNARLQYPATQPE